MAQGSKVVFNIHEDFFLQFPELEPSFQSLKKDWKKSYSEILWALLLDFHPSSSYRSIEAQERRQMLDNDYLGFELDWESFAPQQEILKKFFLSKAQAYLIAWEQKLDERQNLIASIPYSMSTYEDLDKLMATTEKLWKQYQTCLKDVEDEESATLGGIQESMTELNII